MSDRARSKQKRRPRHDSIPADEADRDSMPRPLRLLLDEADRFEEFLDPTKSLDEIAGAVEEQVRAAVDRIVELAAPYDVFDVLADVHLNEVFHNPETYKETEHEGSAAAVEVVAICLAPRLIVSLGAPAARMLAAVTPGLEQWLPWPGFAALRGAERQVVADCEVGEVAFTATAVHHPSAVVSRAVRDLEAGLIENNAHPIRRT